ncbi:ribonuclease P protein component [Lysobacter korlensis]|uniref:Ribonuclease P protein component n=1 Tax=Lysobacter korlensis TaxID=553636 RepID=A0ABV6RWT8_9GAMM
MNRVKTPDEFRRILRRGRRVGGPLLVAHTLHTDGEPVRFGFVVGRGVGNAVVRNRVKRRLRAIAFGFLPALPAGTSVVVRALPPAASATFPDLSAGLREALDRAVVPE